MAVILIQFSFGKKRNPRVKRVGLILLAERKRLLRFATFFALAGYQPTGALTLASRLASNSFPQSSNLSSAYNKKSTPVGAPFIGGKAEIRTLGGVAPSTVFKTAALNHSATFPLSS